MAASSPPPSLPPADDLTDRLLAGRYRLARPIASGGMAQVWEAVDEVLARRVAIKILHRHLAADATFVGRFRAEAIAAARLAHPSIVSIYDTLRDGGIEAIVMELVRGETLRSRLDEHGPLAVPEVVGIATQVCDALGVAHRSGLVHRDVKPANILLSDDGRVLVADFGIAKAAEVADLTRDGVMVGTAKYVAPEQVEGGPVDGRTDLYALGVVLYEALCGRAPFTADTEAATALARLHREPLRPRQVRAGIPRPIEEVVLRSLARRPDDRYPDAASFRMALVAAGDARESAEHRLTGDGSPEGSHRAVSTGEAPSFARSERGWLVPTLLIVLVAVALGVAGLLLGHTAAGRQLIDRVRGVAGGKTAKVVPQRLVAAAAYDPFGDTPPHENDALAPLAIDADPATVWKTEDYRDPNRINGKPGGKPGVGLVVTIEKPASLRQLVVTSPTADWATSIYAVDGAPPAQFDAWGKPLDQRQGITAGDIAFDLHGQKATAVLIWITHLGPDGQVQIGDVRVTGTPS